MTLNGDGTRRQQRQQRSEDASLAQLAKVDFSRGGIHGGRGRIGRRSEGGDSESSAALNVVIGRTNETIHGIPDFRVGDRSICRGG